MNREFPRCGTEKLPYSENVRISSWSCDVEGHAKKCVERYCDKEAIPCIDEHHFKEEELKSVEVLSNVCSKIVLKCFFLARIGRPGILLSVNKRARSITKWTKAVTNDFVFRSLTFIIHLKFNSVAMWEPLPNNADWNCFKTPILLEILRTQNLHQVEHCAFWEAIHLFQSVGCVRNKLQFCTVQQNQKSSPWTLD